MFSVVLPDKQRNTGAAETEGDSTQTPFWPEQPSVETADRVDRREYM